MNRSRLVNLVGIVIGVAGIAFVTTRIVRDREAIADAMSSAEVGRLVVGGAAGTIAMALIGVNWLSILRHAGSGRSSARPNSPIATPRRAARRTPPPRSRWSRPFSEQRPSRRSPAS